MCERIAWWTAGLPDRGHASRTRYRLTFAAFCGPLLLQQGTPDVNHPFLPLGLPVLTVASAVALTALAAAAVVSSRHRPLPRTAAVLLAAVPVWTTVAVAGVPAAGLVVVAGAYLLSFVPMILFDLGGRGHPADGVSLPPGAALLGMVVPAPVAQWIARPDDARQPAPAGALAPATP